MGDNTLRVASWLQPQGVLLDVDARDREHALDVAAAEIGNAHGMDPAPIFRALMRRELAGSTALGNGFAIPHARVAGIGRPLTLFMRTTQPLAFHAPDGLPVSELLVIMVPADGANEDHLQLLALVARLFSDRAFRGLLHGSASVEGVGEVFRRGIAVMLSTSRKDPTQ